jgi:hypothetical protein
MQSITDRIVFKLPEFMSSSAEKKSDNLRPHPLKASRSFSRVEPSSPDRANRPLRASTIQNGIINQNQRVLADRTNTESEMTRPDVFEKSPDGDESQKVGEAAASILPAGDEELPIELASLSDRYTLENYYYVHNN